jgi:hypothetical protein
MTLTRLSDADGLHIGTFDRVFISGWYAPPTVERLAQLAELQRSFTRSIGPHAVFSLIDPRVGREMNADSREASKKISDEMKEHTLAMVFVVMGSGFFAATARSVISGIQWLSRPPYPSEVTSDVDHGAGWMAARLSDAGYPCPTAGLLTAVREMHAGRPGATTTEAPRVRGA